MFRVLCLGNIVCGWAGIVKEACSGHRASGAGCWRLGRCVLTFGGAPLVLKFQHLDSGINVSKIEPVMLQETMESLAGKERKGKGRLVREYPDSTVLIELTNEQWSSVKWWICCPPLRPLERFV